jgi:coenzyme Q-binding protein COQ10
VNKILATTPQHLYDIVIDVDSYKHFLPFCKSSQILRKSDCGTLFDASLTIGVSNLLEEEYVSRVRHVSPKNGKDEWIIEANSMRSKLFHGLSSSWHITSLNKDTLVGDMPTSLGGEHGKTMAKVKFEVEMSVADPILSVALKKILESVAIRQMEAFEKRCKEIPYSLKKEE